MIRWFKWRRAPWGTVYLMVAKNDPSLFKVGYTKRRTKDRRTELNRVKGDDMKIVQAIGMPWARDCEALVLRKFRRSWFRKGDLRGTEWFHLQSGETIDDVARKIEHYAGFIRRQAKAKMSWPKGGELRVFRAGRLAQTC